MAYTTTDLLNNIDRRAFSPTNQNTFNQAARLAMIDEEMISNIFPSIFKLFEEYYVNRTTIPLVANQAGYQIPARALNGQLRELKLTDTNGNMRDLPRIEIESLTNTSTAGRPEYFYLRGNKIQLQPKPADASRSLLVEHFLAPGTSVSPSASAIITAINTSTGVVSFSAIPATFLTGVTHDFIRGTGEHEHIGIDYTNTLVSGTDVTFATLPDDLVVGDYVSLQNQSSIVQCPTIYRNILAQYVAARILQDSGQSGASEAFGKAEKMKYEAEQQMGPRVIGALKTFSATWF